MIDQHILIAVDGIVFTILKQKLHILLIQRAIEPFKDMRALPGWFVLDTENLDQAAYRELEEETNVSNAYLEQLYTFSSVDRDPRGRVIATAYMALLPYAQFDIKSWTDAKNAQLFPIDALPKLWFDHNEVISYAIKRLQRKLEYTNVAQYLLPKTFTLTDLQEVYQIVFGKEFDTRNFRKKLDKLDIVEETGERVIRGAHRPAMLYQFKNKNLTIVEIL